MGNSGFCSCVDMALVLLSGLVVCNLSLTLMLLCSLQDSVLDCDIQKVKECIKVGVRGAGLDQIA